MLVVGYLTAYAAAGSGIARGTTVLGVAIGGLSREEAARVLTRELRDEASARVPVTAGSVRRTVDPGRAGLSFDVDATVESAAARTWNPVDLLDALAGGDDVAPVVDVDRPALRAAVDRVGDRVDRAPVRGRRHRQGHDGAGGPAEGRAAPRSGRRPRTRSPTATWTPTGARSRSSCPRRSPSRRSGRVPSTGLWPMSRSPRCPARSR